MEALRRLTHWLWNALAVFGLVTIAAIIATIVGLWHVFHGVF